MTPASNDAAAYPPFDTLKPIAADLFIVDARPIRTFGLTIPIRMTVVRLATGELWLHSPTPYGETLRNELSKQGPVRHLVAPNIGHWMHVKDWQQRCPNSVVWAAPGVSERGQVRKAGLRVDHELTDAAPEAWRDEIDQVIFRGRVGVSEVAFFHRPSGTVILTDLVQNFERQKTGGIERGLLHVAGSLAPDGRAPLHLRLAMNANRPATAEAARQVLEWEPKRVIFAHGRWIEDDGATELRRRLRWLLNADADAARPASRR